MRQCTVLFLALLAMSPAVQAGPLNFYVGGSLGDSIDVDADDFEVGLNDFEVDSDDTTFKVFAGVGIGRIFGVEAAWHDFGNVTCCEQLADAGFNVDVEGISAAVVAGIPISRLRLFAKVGLISWEVDGTLETLAGPLPFSADGEDVMGGVGADLKLVAGFSVRAEWEAFEVAEGSLNMLSLGVQYKF